MTANNNPFGVRDKSLFESNFAVDKICIVETLVEFCYSLL